MDYFNYRENGQLFAEECNLSELAAQHGTPLYVYSRATLERHWHAFDQAAGPVVAGIPADGAIGEQQQQRGKEDEVDGAPLALLGLA